MLTFWYARLPWPSYSSYTRYHYATSKLPLFFKLNPTIHILVSTQFKSLKTFLLKQQRHRFPTSSVSPFQGRHIQPKYYVEKYLEGSTSSSPSPLKCSWMGKVVHLPLLNLIDFWLWYVYVDSDVKSWECFSLPSIGILVRIQVVSAFRSQIWKYGGSPIRWSPVQDLSKGPRNKAI